MNKSSYWLTIHSTVKKQNKKTHKNLAEYVVEPSNTCSREPTQLPIENTDMVISLPCLKIFHVIPLSRKWSPKSSNKHFTIWLIYLSVPPSSTCQTLPSSQWGLYFQDCCFSFFFFGILSSCLPWQGPAHSSELNSNIISSLRPSPDRMNYSVPIVLFSECYVSHFL